MNKEQKLKLFMSWCNTDLLQKNKRLTAEFVNYKYINGVEAIYIRRMDNENFFASYLLSSVLNKAKQLDLACFVQYRNQLEIEIC